MRTLTAFFDDESDASVAVTRLRDIGIPQDTITMRGGVEESKGFWESLGDMFFPEDDRETYAQHLERGGYLVTVTDLNDSDYALASDILNDAGTIDIDEREKEWKAEGYIPQSRPVSEETVIPVVEERLVVGKRETSGGQTKVRSYVTEKPVQEGVTLREQHVEVERRPADRPATPADIAAQEQSVVGEDTQEEVVLGKEARVVEEIVVKKEVDQHTETVADTVKETHVEVDKPGDRSPRGTKLRK